MSYDLLFVSDPGQPFPDRDLFLEHFAARPLYTVEKDQAVYQNPDTGVYFIFDLVTEVQDEEEPRSWASFNLNFYRPHYFGLEAVPELEALVTRTSGIIFDPQDAEPASRPFVTDQFLKNWNHGNRQSYRIMAEEARKGELSARALVYPTERLEAIWRWNLHRQRRQDTLGEDVFVPKVSFMEVDGGAQSIVVWSDAIPTHLPQVDAVLIYRDRIRKRRWLGGEATLALIPWTDLEPRLSRYTRRDSHLPFVEIADPVPPDSLVDFLRSLPTLGRRPAVVTMDSVLNAELEAEARA